MTTYQVGFSDVVYDQLEFIEKKYYGLIHQTLDEQLGWEPNVETKNRKILEQPAPFSAEWELRFGVGNEFRALYEIDEEERVVLILAIGYKIGNRLFVGGKEIEK